MASGTGIAPQTEQPRETDEELKSENLSMEDQIRRRAHEIWLERDGQGGSDVADWLQAEKEISAR
jgi:Protein of unknown function (DUF2934)